MATSGSAGISPNPNTSTDGWEPAAIRPDAPVKPKQKQKQKGVPDHKAVELEDEFRTKHLGIMGVLTWIL
jgi:phosphatidylinositol glycan class O